MKTIQKSADKLILRGEISESLANAIRRSLSEIPILAIEDIEIFKNDSALYDEVLAHRIGLVPLKTMKSMNQKTKIDFKLIKTGPCVVYSSDLKGPGEIVEPKIPLTILGDGKKLELIATATLGIGKNHAKNSPGLCYYRRVVEVKSSQKIDEIISKSKGLIKAEKKGSKWLCDLNEAETNEIIKIDKDAISDSPEIILIIESFGNMSPKDILSSAIKVLQDNLSYFEKSIK